MPLAVPVAETQVWLFSALSLVFFAFVVRAMIQRQTETSARHEASSRLCIIVQSVGIGMAGIGPMRPILPSSSLPAIAGCAAVLLLMGGSIALFASSSTALGKNWSFEARLMALSSAIRFISGCYSSCSALRSRLATGSSSSWRYRSSLIGTKMRTNAEDRLLEASFGPEFVAYRNSTPALFPRPAR